MFRPILICAGLMMASLGNAAAGAEDAPAQPSAAGPQAEQALQEQALPEQTLPSPKEWLAQRQAEMEAYEISLEREKPRKLVLESRSLLNWSNAERGADVGAVFLWTDRGRPEMIASAFGRDKLLRHEFHSLSTEPLVVRRGEVEVHRFGPGIAWQELSAESGAGKAPPPPAKQRALRLTQMRRQAERFRVVMGGKQPVQMRLLTQPVYRTPAELEDDIGAVRLRAGNRPGMRADAPGHGGGQVAILPDAPDQVAAQSRARRHRGHRFSLPGPHASRIPLLRPQAAGSGGMSCGGWNFEIRLGAGCRCWLAQQCLGGVALPAMELIAAGDEAGKGRLSTGADRFPSPLQGFRLLKGVRLEARRVSEEEAVRFPRSRFGLPRPAAT